MPPRSRGWQPQRRSNTFEQGDAAWNRRDPLSLLASFILYPILLLALGVLHISYYVALKLRSTSAQLPQRRASDDDVRRQEYTETMKRLFSPVRKAEASERRAEEDLRRMCEALSRRQNERVANDDVAMLKAFKRGVSPSMPHHVALVIGPKPVRTRVLLCRWALSALRLRSRARRDKDAADDEAGQVSFASRNLFAAIRYCTLAGVEELTVYDKKGILSILHTHGHTQTLSFAQRGGSDADKLNVKITFHQPFQSKAMNGNGHLHFDENKGEHVHAIKVNVLGPQDAKDALARVATDLYRRQQQQQCLARQQEAERTLCVKDEVVANELHLHGYPSEPDLLILHGGPRHVSTLHGFPPWLVRLCEIFHDVDATPYHVISAKSFLCAINVYMKAEQRFGK